MSCKLPNKFKFLDKNFNELQFPDGIRASGIIVHSIEKERYSEKVEGIPGNINYGSDFNSRKIDLHFTLSTKYEFDYSLMRNDLYEIFSHNDIIYLVENTLPSRFIGITIDESVSPENVALYFHSKLEISVESSGLPFWRTKYTSQELNDEGYTAIVDKYGTADNIHIDQTKYTYKTNEFTIYNSGNVTIDPRYMELSIRLRYVNSPGNFTIENVTTGEKFVYKSAINNNHLTLDGIKVNVGVYNRLRDSNRQFISLVKGVNKIKIYNGTFEEIKFNSPFYFK